MFRLSLKGLKESKETITIILDPIYDDEDLIMRKRYFIQQSSKETLDGKKWMK